MTKPARLLAPGEVSALRSQALYHGLADAMDADSPDTIAILSPASPYFCVGIHQDPAEELDLAWCRRQGYPVLHRRIGGGTVYLDRSQLFYQCVFHRSRAPFDVASIYRRCLEPPVEALRRLGLRATLRAVNEVEVRGKRIAGTGGGQLGDAMVVTGNILFDFNYEAMVRAWKVPSAAFRGLASEGLDRYVTTLRRELDAPPAMPEVARLLVECYAEGLGRPLVPAGLTRREEEAVLRTAEELASEPMMAGPPRQASRGLKIAGETYVRESARPDLTVTVRLRGAVIDAVRVSREEWSPAARTVVGCRLDERALRERIQDAPGGVEILDALLTLHGSRDELALRG
jgi:lipoate-protein ligase A